MEKQEMINVCNNAITILLEYWETEQGKMWDATMRETIIGLNEIKLSL